MENIRPRSKSELKRLYTNLKNKGITDVMMSDLIEACYNEKPNMRTSGFDIPADPDALMSFDPVTRIFTIAPFDPEVEGFNPRFGIYTWAEEAVYHRIFEALTINIPWEEGLYLIYIDIDAETLLPELFYLVNPITENIREIITKKVSVAAIYWDAVNNSVIYFGDDRHGSEWNPQIHWYLHNSFGAKRKTGLQFQNMIVNGDGSSNDHAKFDITEGVMLHDDIELTIPAAGTEIPILNFYTDHVPRFATYYGYSVWKGNNRLCYNMACTHAVEAESGNFLMYHYFATNDLLPVDGRGNHRKIISVMGTNEYTNSGAAYYGVEAELNAIKQYMPQQGKCWLGSVMFQVDDAYTNDIKARVVGFIGNDKNHLPVTIAEDSQAYLEIDENQVLGFKPESIVTIPLTPSQLFTYVAWASDDQGSDFSLTFNPALHWMAIIMSKTEIASPQASDFSGQWFYHGAWLNEWGEQINLVPIMSANGHYSPDCCAFFLYHDGDTETPDRNSVYCVAFNGEKGWRIIQEQMAISANQAGNGFAGGEPVYRAAGGWAGADANDIAHAAVGMVLRPKHWNTVMPKHTPYEQAEWDAFDGYDDYGDDVFFVLNCGFLPGAYTDSVRYYLSLTTGQIVDEATALAYETGKVLQYIGTGAIQPAFENLPAIPGMMLNIGEPRIIGAEPVDGITPHIGLNGNWYIGETDTGIPAQGNDGAPGAPGYTPVKGVDYFDGDDGAPGAPGNDGYTPVKGVDYFDGDDGAPGADGNTPYIQGGYWYIDGVNTGVLAAGTPGAPGAPGTSSYTYVAYATDNAGTGFSLTPTDLLKYRAEIHPSSPLSPPTSANFAGATWVKYIGDDGEDGTGGTGGAEPPELHLDFGETGLAYTYNVPYAMKFTSMVCEGTDATLSVALNTNLARYDKLTITATAAGLVSLYGEYV